ncbi:RNA polymerase sigma factor [Spirosoma panaciterrae]|uniref:RNA polymerase sigma factor n=1 Tax=Spirosoma panaciterrae TaxID=496058 RepID=UPI000379DC6E|nr:sigma-70 family RNA polymerase sigma factor [Spirosoma panaciterrae]
MGQIVSVFRQPNQPIRIETDLDQDDTPFQASFSDDELFIRKTLVDNPQQGVELLYKRYYQPLCTHTVRFVGSREVAEDLVSEIFYQFYSEELFSQITTSYRAYLFRTARNRAYNYLRWELSRKSPLEDASTFSVQEYRQPDAITQYEELCQDVERAINTLPLDRRKIYLLYQFEGKKLRDIADDLQISVRTVETQVYRASQAIRKLLKDKWLLITILALFSLH